MDKITKTKWTKEEEDFLVENYPAQGYKYCAEALERTGASVLAKVKRMKLKTGRSFSLKTHEQYEMDIMVKDLPIVPIDTYINAKTPILHQCFEGHSWKASPDNILRGFGCPECHAPGTSHNIPTILYYVKIEVPYAKYYKIGITSVSIAARFMADSDKKITVLLEKLYDNREDAKIAEQSVLNTFKDFRIKENNFLKSKGNTELFSTDVLELDTLST